MTDRVSAATDPLRTGSPRDAILRLLEIGGAGATVGLSPHPALAPLAPGQCHLWRLPLTLPPHVLMGLEALLADAERERADAFRVPVPRRHFIATRAALRLLLARYLGTSAADCRFAYGEFGKPYLTHPATRLRFNVAHSGEQALFAVADGIDIGIDLEWHRDIPELEQLAASVLSPRQLPHWLRLPAAAKSQAFHDAWARKEAVIKAAGAGLSIELHALDVEFLPGERAGVLRIADALGPPAAWSMLPLEVGTGYSAAVAARVQGLQAV